MLPLRSRSSQKPVAPAWPVTSRCAPARATLIASPLCIRLQVAVTRVSEWATEEVSRLPEGHESRAKLITILEELPGYGSPEFEDFNEINLVPLLRGLKEGTIGRKHKESEGLMQTNPQRAQKVRRCRRPVGSEAVDFFRSAGPQLTMPPPWLDLPACRRKRPWRQWPCSCYTRSTPCTRTPSA